MTETTNGTTNGSGAAAPVAAAPAKLAEAASPMPSMAATSGSEGQGSPEPPLVPPPPAAAAAAAAAKTPVRGTAGRIKAPPSATASMQRQAFSHVDLSKLCWDMSSSASVAPAASADTGVGDGKSNGSGNGNGNGAKAEQEQARTSSTNQPSAVATSGSSSSSSSSASSHPAAAVGARSQPAPAPTPAVERTVSRTGRETQRWATDPHTGQLIRLTTGCVPVMKDGRILFCSSSRKEAWILPKGGWESDETMEESALRETFEEAGVLGTLGPVLDEVEYETRKAKKRRLERENLIKTMMEEQWRGSLTSSGITSTSGGGVSGFSSGDEHGAQQKAADTSGNGKAAAVEGAPPNYGDIPPTGSLDPKPPPNDGSMSPPAAPVAVANAAPVFRIQQLQQLQHAGTYGAGAGNDDTASVASVASMTSDTSTSCTHARMRLFPLYVSEVRDEWPESGRARKVLHIDAAIELMESRPEFQRALIEVRDRRLHLTGPPTVPATAPPVATGTATES